MVVDREDDDDESCWNWYEFGEELGDWNKLMEDEDEGDGCVCVVMCDGVAATVQDWAVFCDTVPPSDTMGLPD